MSPASASASGSWIPLIPLNLLEPNASGVSQTDASAAAVDATTFETTRHAVPRMGASGEDDRVLSRLTEALPRDVISYLHLLGRCSPDGQRETSFNRIEAISRPDPPETKAGSEAEGDGEGYSRTRARRVVMGYNLLVKCARQGRGIISQTEQDGEEQYTDVPYSQMWAIWIEIIDRKLGRYPMQQASPTPLVAPDIFIHDAYDSFVITNVRVPLPSDLLDDKALASVSDDELDRVVRWLYLYPYHPCAHWLNGSIDLYGLKPAVHMASDRDERLHMKGILPVRYSLRPKSPARLGPEQQQQQPPQRHAPQKDKLNTTTDVDPSSRRADSANTNTMAAKPTPPLPPSSPLSDDRRVAREGTVSLSSGQLLTYRQLSVPQLPFIIQADSNNGHTEAIVWGQNDGQALVSLIGRLADETLSSPADAAQASARV